MLKAKAKAICDEHDGDIPANYDAHIYLPGDNDRVAMLYLNYSAERSEVSLFSVM